MMTARLHTGGKITDEHRNNTHTSCTLGSCGIPSIWRSPTTRQPEGSPDGTGASVVWLCPRGAVW